MSRISSSVGLITGIPIEETVNKLMAVAARPRDMLATRTKSLDAERLAVTKLTSLMLAFEFEVNRLSAASLFQAKDVGSSDSSTIKATLASGGNPALGSYQFRPLQLASSQQLASSSFQSLSDLAESGTLTFGFGGFVDKGIALDQLNAGAGVARGAIRITDRSGESAEIDLRLSQTVDDVLNAINNNTSASVRAKVVGDTFVLTDTSGGSGNLRVQEVGTGTTAADLGLAAINVAASEATGTDVFSLHDRTKLSSLNDGTGVALADGNDLEVTLADGSALNIDFDDATTLGEVLAAFNAVAPGKLTASLAADGNRIELTDLTAGGGVFDVASVGSGSTAEDLGLSTPANGNTITGDRLASGLRDTLISSLRAGQGLGTLGVIAITNRAGVTSNVDLASAETLGEIVNAINTTAVGVSASVNAARNGIALVDMTGASASNLIVADGDASASATALGLVIDEATSVADSGSLNRKQLSRGTLLSSLNGGKGIDIGDILITDSSGATGAADLNKPGNNAKTVGDVIDRINAIASINVEARINDTGDGILLIDHANGPGKLEVKDAGAHTTARDLRLLGSGVEREIGGVTKLVVDGTAQHRIDLAGLSDPGADILLSSLNSGRGVANGAFKIHDSNGQSDVVVISPTVGTFTSVADVIDAINATDIGVEARINDAGTGIVLIDTAGGDGTLKLEEVADGTTAADLGLDSAVTSIVDDGIERQAVDGEGTFSQSATQTGLAALATRINSLDAGVTASTIFDGSGYRLLLNVDKSGAANELLVDGLGTGLEFEQLSAARDAVVEFGGVAGGSGLLLTSSDNTFNDVVPGVELTLLATSQQNVTIDVTKAQSQITATVTDFVDAFNSIQDNLDEVTSFDAEAQTTGILFGSTAVLRVESDLNRVLTGRFSGLGKFMSLEAIGLSFDDSGRLELSTSKLEAALAEDPAAVEKLFTDNTRGISAKVKAAIASLASDTNSVLSARANTLADRINDNKQRITFMEERLTRERQRLLLTFAQLESSIAAMQQNLSALASLQPIPPLTSTARS